MPGPTRADPKSTCPPGHPEQRQSLCRTVNCDGGFAELPCSPREGVIEARAQPSRPLTMADTACPTPQQSPRSAQESIKTSFEILSFV